MRLPSGLLAHGERVAAAVKDERRAIGVIERLDRADEDHVIAPLMAEGGAALEPRGAAAQERYPGGTALEIEAGELGRAARGESQ